MASFIDETHFTNPFKGSLYQNYDKWVDYLKIVETSKGVFWLDVVLELHKLRSDVGSQVLSMMIPREKYPELFEDQAYPSITRTDLLDKVKTEHLKVVYELFSALLLEISEVSDEQGTDRPPYYKEWDRIYETIQTILAKRGEFYE